MESKVKCVKRSVLLLTIMAFLCSCFQVNAARHQDNLPMEGELDDIGARSIDPTQPVQAFLDENTVSVEFYRYISDVTISIKDSNNNVVYTKTCAAPEVEIISLAGFESGSYTLELRTERGGYMYGTFLYVY